MKKKKQKVKFLKDVEAHDYPAALSYLSLIYNPEKAKMFVEALKNTEVVHFKAKDIFRASRESSLGSNNSHMKSNLKKIKEGKRLSPLLLVRDSANGKVIIADGYHRICATHFYNEDMDIPCKIV